MGESAYKVVGVFQDKKVEIERNDKYIYPIQLQLMEKNNDKIDQIIVRFKQELGYIGALAFEKELTDFLKVKKL